MGAPKWPPSPRRSDAPRRSRGAPRDPQDSLALGPVQQILKFFLRLSEHLSGRCTLDPLLDGDADDVAVLGDADDLGKSLPADLERGLIGRIPVGGHLRLGL